MEREGWGQVVVSKAKTRSPKLVMGPIGLGDTFG